MKRPGTLLNDRKRVFLTCTHHQPKLTLYTSCDSEITFVSVIQVTFLLGGRG